MPSFCSPEDSIPATTLAIAASQGFTHYRPLLRLRPAAPPRNPAAAASPATTSRPPRHHENRPAGLRRFRPTPTSTSPRTSPGQENPDHSAIPITYVPARNTVFLSFALGLAEVTGAFDIFIGVNAVDYSGYPDCRPEFIAAFETSPTSPPRRAWKNRHVQIHAPLIR